MSQNNNIMKRYIVLRLNGSIKGYGYYTCKFCGTKCLSFNSERRNRSKKHKDSIRRIELKENKTIIHFNPITAEIYN